ncbi:MAG: addiction module protein [Pirellulales bacterium]|nr:addiction module protein [Pirellulales bacterium]
MPTNEQIQDVIASVLALPAEQRLEVMDAIHVSLVDSSIDHGPIEPAEDVAAAWKDEIARRIADVDNGRVKTIPAEQAERMIRGDAKPAV